MNAMDTMPYEDYALLPGLNASSIKHGVKSMLHMKAARDGELPKGSKALRWGKLIHSAILEPEMLFQRVEVWEGDRKYGKLWDSFLADCGGSDEWIVSREEQSALQRMSNAVHANSDAHWLIEGTKHEMVFQWKDPLYKEAKMRCDGYSERIGLLELKSTSKILPRQFASQCAQLGYDMQLGWYATGIRACGLPCDRVAIIAVESSAPYCVVYYDVPDALIAKGAEKAIAIARAYRCCEGTGHFPGVADERQILELPDWAEEEKEVSMEGIE